MRSTTWKVVRGIGGGLLVAVVLYLALAAPGLLAARGGRVPLHSDWMAH